MGEQVNPGMPNNTQYNFGLNANATTETDAKKKTTTGGEQSEVKNKRIKDNTIFGDDITSDNKTGQTYASTSAQSTTGAENPGKAGEPSLPKPGNYDMGEVVKESKVNDWFNTSYMVTLSEAYTEIILLNKDIHKVEGEFMVEQLAAVWKTAEVLGALIIAKAEQEAAMHMAQAIGGFASVGIAAFGTALSVGGRARATDAKNQSLAMDEGLSAKKPDKQVEVKAGATADVGTAKAAKPVEQPSASADATASKVADQKAALKHQKKKDAAKADSERTIEQKVSERQKLNEKEASGENYASIGAGVTQLAMPASQIVDNFIQMYYKPLIAEYDQQMELVRAFKDILMKGIDSTAQAFSGATQEVDAAMNAAIKVQDAEQQAHSLKG